ncbi:arylsulfotransferase protein [Rutstroemia sp. NJR-2017a BVV2]|nr:arylsulfotransferase protein [Rutstroemia sp. NJR-2017a BVV2]
MGLSVLSLFFLAFLCTSIVAELGPYVNDEGYDAGTYGVYPINTYMSTDIASPRVNILSKSEECRNDLYWVFSPRGRAVSQPSAMIMDSDGNLVWTKSGYDQIYNLQVQTYRGEQYLTFWAGSDAVFGHGAGVYYMLDKHYREVHKIVAANGLAGDLHDFTITDNGTALITIYDVVIADMAYVGYPEGYVWDCVIQEIDLGTGELLFEWRAAQHYAVSDTYRDKPDSDGGVYSAFDFFHINSVDKDEKGNFLISSRYLHCLTYINGTTGDIIWILGGKKNMFTDLSDGRATDFAYQHDARWRHNRTAISIFDNAGDDAHPGPASRGLLMEVDEVNMTVKVIQEYMNPNGIRGISQGNMQMLEDGHVIMGYGNTGAMTEYAPNGTTLCDQHFGPQSRFGAGEVQSYRVFKFEWHGWPTTDPDVRILTNGENWLSLYVSWNGATEVTQWVLQGAEDAEAEEEEWETLDYADKTSFETEFEISRIYPRYLRVKGMANNGTKEKDLLGVSYALDVNMEKVWSLKPVRLEGGSSYPLLALMAFAGITGLVVGIREALIWRKKRRGTSLLRWRPEGLGVPLMGSGS